jgi:hypothetical protein
VQGPVDILAGDFYGRLSRQPVSKFKGLTAFPVEVKKKKIILLLSLGLVDFSTCGNQKAL